MSKTIPLDTALECMEDESFMESLEEGYGGFNRSLLNMEDLQRNPHLGRFLKEVLASGMSIDTLESNTTLDRCYKKGWLQAALVPRGRNDEGSRRAYVFPSNLHEK